MTCLVLDEDQVDELADLNASGSPERQLQAVTLSDGRVILNADLLEDCGPGQTWEHYGVFLDGLEIEEIDLEEFTPVS